MLKFIGLPILIAYGLGYYFPYHALKLSPYAFIILFLMMTSSLLNIKWSILKKIKINFKEIVSSLFFLFFFFPLLQMFLANLLISEESLSHGALLASLCPIAIVAPNFTKMYKGDEQLSYLLMIISMILFPLIIFLSYSFFSQTIHLKPIIIDMLILIFCPLGISYIVKKIDRKFFQNCIFQNWKKITQELDMFAIAFLAFIYFGASMSKLNLNYIPWKELLSVLLVITFQDFGVYFLIKWIMKHFFSTEKAVAITISLSMKNFAVSGAILMIYDPKASLPSAVGFLVHAFFFNYLVLNKPKN